jgi:hypothetical protein
MCPSCTISRETAGHILRCGEEGRVKALQKFSVHLMQWMGSVGTNRDLIYLFGKYIRGRGHLKMEEICEESHLPSSFMSFAASQDRIGWRRFLEGMVSQDLVLLAEQGEILEDCRLSVDVWMWELITRLLELTHSMWIYRNLVVHDSSTGIHAIWRKEALQVEIERQIALGGEGLEEGDQWMLEVNFTDWEDSGSEREAYWLMAIEAAREYHTKRRDSASASEPL